MSEENNKSASALREEKILEFWRENQVFQKSLEKDAPHGNYVFYDGPPFATGLPHYGHILGSTAKDVIGRYQTMRGFRVPRKWGWDCHGLPIENIVEKDLKVSGHKEIEALGVEKFVEHARSKVLTYVHDWKRTVERIGRWVDFDGSYKTMDNSFIESVWWALGELNSKGLLYENVRVLAYCPRCETPIAKSEIAMDNSYKDIADISVYVKMPLADQPDTFLLAWTTTPWSLPGNIVCAVNAEATYVRAQVENEFYILAKDRVETVLKDKSYGILDEFPGSTLVGTKYLPPFNYYTQKPELVANPKSWTVVAASFVTTTDGTGIAHEAPAFGEDDATLAKEQDIPFIVHVTPEGKFTAEVIDFAGLSIKPKSDEKDGHQKTDIEIIKYLAGKNLLFKKEKIMHPYPHCYRCDTPLFYYALPSWFVNIQAAKENMLDKAKTMEWIPSHLKDGRFRHTMEGAPDWTVSRNRYWASPIPAWKSASGKMLFVNSIADLRAKTKKSGNKYFVIRHGQTDVNLKGMVSCDPNEPVPLTALGREQVAAQVDFLKEQGIELIITSPFVRTRETAEIIRAGLGLAESEVLVDDRLREMDIGVYKKGSWSAFHEAFPKTVENFDRAPEGGESYQTVKSWMMNFMHDLEIKYKNKKILIVSHGSPSWLLMAGAQGFNAQESLDLVLNKVEFHYFQNAEVMEVPYVPFPHNARWELDLHRPYIDSIVLTDGVEDYYRITEVIDCWFESGSMPFAQDHYPFARPDWQKENFPGGFVAEYIAQTRTWFYYTHALSTILFDKAPFEHVVTTGTLLAEDGQKMSKSKGNYPDPWILFDKYGVDPLRLYLMASPLMKGEDSNFSEKLVQEIASKIIGRLGNVVTFYELYRDVALEKAPMTSSTNVLDIWILARLHSLVAEMTKGMQAYDMTEATRPLDLFIDDLSTWYLRRSRERIKDGDKEAKQTLYRVLKITATVMAPFTPFIAEDVWLRLKHESDVLSVHLAEWPVAENLGLLTEEAINKITVIETMKQARMIVTFGMEARQKAKIAVRQPLAKLTIKTRVLTQEYLDIVADELNVKQVVVDEQFAGDVSLDLDITPELKREGDYRELVRAVQDLRKTKGLTPSDTILLTLADEYKAIVAGFETDMEKTVLAKSIAFGLPNGEKIAITLQ